MYGDIGDCDLARLMIVNGCKGVVECQSQGCTLSAEEHISATCFFRSLLHVLHGNHDATPYMQPSLFSGHELLSPSDTSWFFCRNPLEFLLSKDTYASGKFCKIWTGSVDLLM